VSYAGVAAELSSYTGELRCVFTLKMALKQLQNVCLSFGAFLRLSRDFCRLAQSAFPIPDSQLGIFFLLLTLSLFGMHCSDFLKDWASKAQSFP
jgi:hypothetical protein